MPHRHHGGAVRLHRGESRKYLEALTWALIGLVLYVMIRFVLIDIVQFARMPRVPLADQTRALPAAVQPAPVAQSP